MKLTQSIVSKNTLRLMLACGLCLSFAGGCGTGGSGSGAASSTNTNSMSADSTTRTLPENGSLDAEFVDRMSHFAELSTHLAELELSNGQRPAVQELAEKIKRRESVDVAFLQAERARLGLASRGTDMSNDPQANDLRRRMQAATPEEADTLFVERMIKHRLEAAKYAESCLPNLHSPNLNYYCRAVSEDSGAALRELRSVQTAEQAVPVNARAGKKGFQSNTRR